MESPIRYSQHNASETPHIKKILEDFAPILSNTTKTDNILDIGCGAGDVTKNILEPCLKHYRKIIGIDISEPAIQYARENYQSDDIVYEVLDIESDINHFKSKWNSFSRIFSFLCLNWISDWNKTIANISELLSYDAECLLYFATSAMIYEVWLIMSASTRWNKYMMDANQMLKSVHDDWKPTSELPRLMNENGLVLLSCEEVDYESRFDDIDYLKGYLRSVDPFITRIPEKHKEIYLEDSINIFKSFPTFETNVNNQTKYTVLSKRTIVRAKKGKN